VFRHLTPKLTVWVFKFSHMVYKKHITCTEKDKNMKQMEFVENRTEIMQDVLKRKSSNFPCCLNV